MKNIYLLAFLALGFTAKAQTTIWSENFDDLDITDWTILDEDYDGYTWDAAQLTNDEGLPSGTPILTSVSWNSLEGALYPDNWAITPAIDLANYPSNEITLNWQVFASDPLYNLENYDVYVSTTNDVDSFLAEGSKFNEVNLPSTLTPRSISLSDFAGQIIYIAFRHHDVSDEFRIGLDNMSVVAEELGISNSNAQNVNSIYPNPAKNEFNLKLSSLINTQNLAVEIIDVTGKSVAKYFNATNFNIEKLPAGVYVVKISDGKFTETKKLIKK